MEKVLGFIVGVTCVGVLVLWGMAPNEPAEIVAVAAPVTADIPTGESQPLGRCPPDDLHLRCPAVLSAAQIDSILAAAGSPAAGIGGYWIELGAAYNINPEIALAFFKHESSFGVDPNWAGIKPGGATTHNVGNLICAGYPTCYGRFRDYPSWKEGIEGWYQLIAVEYIGGRGHATVEDVIPVYAPAFENDVQNYIERVRQQVKEWRM